MQAEYVMKQTWTVMHFLIQYILHFLIPNENNKCAILYQPDWNTSQQCSCPPGQEIQNSCFPGMGQSLIGCHWNPLLQSINAAAALYASHIVLDPRFKPHPTCCFGLNVFFDLLKPLPVVEWQKNKTGKELISITKLLSVKKEHGRVKRWATSLCEYWHLQMTIWRNGFWVSCSVKRDTKLQTDQVH